MTRAIIFAGGDATRWGNHLGTPKHLVPVPTADGGTTPLMCRTVRQLTDRGISDIHAIVDQGDGRYHSTGAITHQRQPSTTGCSVWLRSMPLWSKTGRTLILLGDWWHSATSMDRIVAAGERREWLHLCRVGPSETTGQPYGEDAGASFWPEHHIEFAAMIGRVHGLATAGLISRGGSWEVWCAMNGVADTDLVLPAGMDTLGRRVDLPDDGSGDFDLPRDYTGWLAALGDGRVDAT